MAQEVPFAIRGAYQLKQYNAGIPQEPDNSVFDALALPPESGVDAVAASVTAAQDVGIIQPDAAAVLRVKAHRDEIRDFYDSASIQEPEA